MEEKNPKKEELDFVYDDDLIPVFEKLSIKDDFINGKLVCYYCNKKVTNKNLSAFFLENEQIRLICNEKDCLGKLGKRGQNL